MTSIKDYLGNSEAFVGIHPNPNAGVFTISGTPSVTVGSPYSYTVTTSGSGACPAVTATGTITVIPQSDSGAGSGTDG